MKSTTCPPVYVDALTSVGVDQSLIKLTALSGKHEIGCIMSRATAEALASQLQLLLRESTRKPAAA